MLEVREYHGSKYSSIPANLVGKEGPEYRAGSLDHRVLWQRKGKPIYLTSEPYYVRKDGLKELIAHCDEHDIDFQIDAESCYYPGHTVRFLFKKGHVDQYDAMQQMAGERKIV